jgi:hypothetical protein
MTYEEMWKELKLSSNQKLVELLTLSIKTANLKERNRLAAKVEGVRLIVEDMNRLEEV